MAKVSSIFTKKFPTSTFGRINPTSTFGRINPSSVFTEMGDEYTTPTVYYSGIIASLNLLTDTLDTTYDGTDPTLAGMETALDTINGEIITP
jgi:hypothetical protein